MEISRISPYPDHCSVTVDIPWELADAIVESGPSLINSLKNVLNEHKARVQKDELLKSLRNKEAPSPEFEWWPLAIKADKRIRSLVKTDNLTPSKALGQTAKEFNYPSSSMQALISVYRKKVKEDLSRKRTLEIIQLHFRGISTQIIADHLEINVRSIQRILRENQDIVEFARTELEEFKNEVFCRQGVMSEAVLREEGRGSPRPTTSLKKPLLKNSSSRLQAKTVLLTHSTLVINFDERKEEHRKLGIQLYRHYRRLNPTGNTGRSICKELQAVYDLDVVYIEHLIRVRRKLVKDYLRSRQLKTILRLRTNKHSLAEVAAVVKLHIKTVEKIIRQHKASKKGGFQ